MPVDAENDWQQTTLHLAAGSGSLPAVQVLLAAGASMARAHWLEQPLEPPERRARTIVALVAAGDRDSALVPRPCPGMEGALKPVWRAAPGELPQLVARLTLDALERVRTALRVLRLRTPLPPHLLMPVLARAFDS